MSRRGSPESVEIDDVFIKTRTLKAVLITKDGVEYWVPLSQVVGEVMLTAVGDLDTIRIAAWFAKKEGLI